MTKAAVLVAGVSVAAGFLVPSDRDCRVGLLGQWQDCPAV